MLQTVKAYLKITWDDEDAGLTDLISRGQEYLNNLVGAELNFEEALPCSLLLDYCRYSYNNAIEYFEDNFQKEILRLQLSTAAAELAAAEAAEAEA